MTSHTESAVRYIETVWGNDGGAVAETARLGSVAEADMQALRALHGDEAEQVAAALVAECQDRA